MFNKKPELAAFYNSAPAVVALVSGQPLWIVVFNIVYGFMGLRMQYKQDETNEIAKLVNDKKKFPAEIICSNEFRDGFLVFFEDFLKIRDDKKKEFSKRVLLGFTSAKDKKKFQIERLLSANRRISFEAILFLGKVKNALPKMYKEAHKNVNRDKKNKNVPYDREQFYLKQLDILSFIIKPNENCIEDWEEDRKQKATINELIGLDILIRGWRNQGEVYITDFGCEFLDYLEN